jgi:hypothetical protein
MKKIMFVFKMTAALCMLMFAVSSFGGMGDEPSAGPASSAKFVSHGQPAQQEDSAIMAWVKTKAEAVLPEGAMTALTAAGSRVEGIGGLAGVFSLAIPEESWEVFSNLGDLL